MHVLRLIALLAFLAGPCRAESKVETLRFEGEGFTIEPLPSPNSQNQQDMIVALYDATSGGRVIVSSWWAGPSWLAFLLDAPWVVEFGIKMQSGASNFKAVSVSPNEWIYEWEDYGSHYMKRHVRIHEKVYEIQATASRAEWDKASAKLVECAQSFMVRANGNSIPQDPGTLRFRAECFCIRPFPPASTVTTRRRIVEFGDRNSLGGRVCVDVYPPAAIGDFAQMFRRQLDDRLGGTINSGKIIKEAMAAPNIWEMECEGVLEGHGGGGHFLRAVRAEKQIYLVSADDSTSVRTAGGWEDEWPRVSSRLIECVRSFALAKQQTK